MIASTMDKTIESLCAELVQKSAPLVSAIENPTGIAALTLYRHLEPTPPAPAQYLPSIALVVQGSKRVHLGQHSFIYDRSRFLVTAIDLPVSSEVLDASVAAPYMCLRLALDIRLVREVLVSTPPITNMTEMTGAAAPDTCGMGTGAVTVELAAAFGRMLDLLGSHEPPAFLSDLLQREIIYRVLHSEAGARLRAIATTGGDSDRTVRAVDWIREHYTEPLRMAQLAQQAGMGVSTLHHHFRRLTSMSPLQYQKQLRLHEARRRMLIDGLDAASAAFDVGYESASQFNREYSRVFGCSPMRDIRARRDGWRT